ncbi:MAG: hypothetical protein B6U88_01345 [Candidatus Aenigmarchaeota archaeon ex4484_56]|nr:MAG: hypothetical protein B6U88_01345 [Candidatus Aenigmarchaeota archaeon ex4484_56]
MEVDIIPMGNINSDIIEELKRELKNKNLIVRTYAKMDLPNTALNLYRKQYNAQILVDVLRNLKGIIIAVTDKDIYTDKLNYVFSYEEYDGPAIISLYRLRSEYYQEKRNFDLLIDRLTKTVIYSLGKLKGLKDCNNLTCVMHKPNSVEDIDHKSKEFCNDCKLNNTLIGIEL